ncbi:hypothetical protein PMAYCL1PPCAC_12312, partial [Pristionchus mayeri]
SVFSADCVLDRFECDQYGECPIHRQHQVDCDGNKEGLVLAVFHSGFEYGYMQVKKLGCDSSNGWWTVNGKSLPSSAIVDCVWPMELETSSVVTDRWLQSPTTVNGRALSDVGPTVRNAAAIVAVMAFVVVVIGVIIVNTRLKGPKTRIVTRELRSLYRSLLNDEARIDAIKAEMEYKSVDCEAAGLALYQFYKLEGDCDLELHMHWTSLSWPNRNLLIERALLHRAFFGLKVLYDKFDLPENEMDSEARPGLKEKIIKASKTYKSFVEKWTASELLHSLAFASLSKADLDAFRKNEVKRKIIRPKPTKENSVSGITELVATDAPGADASRK